MMKKITQKEPDKIIEKHELWLKGEDGGERADLSNKDLSFMSLAGVNLCGANFSSANLFCASFSDTNLCRANLAGANLCDAFLVRTNLTEADICQTNFHKAKIAGANLGGVIADDNTKYFNLVCPEEGSFIGWKKAFSKDWYQVLIKLLIPKDAKRSSATTRKCRASKAKVLKMVVAETGEVVDVAYSCYQSDFEYHTGEYVYPDSFDEDRWIECANGIHFFMTKQEAIDY